MRIRVDLPSAAVEALNRVGVGGSAEEPFNFVYVSREGARQGSRVTEISVIRNPTVGIASRAILRWNWRMVWASTQPDCPPRLLLPRPYWSATA